MTLNRPAAVHVVATMLSTGVCLFFLYTAVFGLFPAVTQRGAVLLPSLLLVFLLPLGTGGVSRWLLTSRLAGSALAVVAVLHFVFNQDAIMFRGGEATALDLAAGAVLMVVVLEATRQKYGWSLVVLALLFLGYAYYGSVLPGVLRHHGASLSYIVTKTTVLTDGIWGLPLQVAANYVFPFILLAAVLNAAGVGDAFLRISQALVGGHRGGPAKIAVVASGFFGSISGSAVANVAGTGAFTIPLMKRVGYSPEAAAGIEAVASTGGQFMPPIMAASAFIIAEILQVPYYEVALAAAVPAILYYLALLVMVHLQASKAGLHGMPREDIPALWPAFAGTWHLFIPLVVLVYLLVVVQYSPMRAGIWSIGAAIVFSFVNRDSWLTPRRLIGAFRSATLEMSGIAVVCATAGIVLSMIDLVGLPAKLSAILLSLAGDSLLLLLVLAMTASIILGTGLPTVAAYVILAIMVVPALQNMGVQPMASHLFVFYFGILSFITPPVALAAYTGAGIAGADPVKTCWWALRLGVPGFIVPYMFVYGPALLLYGPAWHVALAIVSALIGIVALASAIEGHLWRPAGPVERVLFAAGALLLIKPGLVTDLIGAVCLVAGLVVHFHWRVLPARWSSPKPAPAGRS
ncbi:MAG: TRAP transporter fused permease subunit [Candidatus Rokubacteria bacterium]|nr:TRAP transporter fused permease subunit [Candidatus Rokubacteria bacterium]